MTSSRVTDSSRPRPKLPEILTKENNKNHTAPNSEHTRPRATQANNATRTGMRNQQQGSSTRSARGRRFQKSFTRNELFQRAGRTVYLADLTTPVRWRPNYSEWARG